MKWIFFPGHAVGHMNPPRVPSDRPFLKFLGRMHSNRMQLPNEPQAFASASSLTSKHSANTSSSEKKNMIHNPLFGDWLLTGLFVRTREIFLLQACQEYVLSNVTTLDNPSICYC